MIIRSSMKFYYRFKNFRNILLFIKIILSMDQVNIALNLATSLYQQSVLFLEKMQQQSLELSEFMLTNFALIPQDSESEMEQSKDEVSDKIKVEAQEQNLEQNQSVYNQTEKEKLQLHYQLYSFKRQKQNDDIIFDVPQQIDGIYLLKDKLSVPTYIPQEVVLEKQGIKKNKTKTKFTEKVSKFQTNLQQPQVITRKGKLNYLAEGDANQKINNKQKKQEISASLKSETKHKKKDTLRHSRYQKREQTYNQQFEEDSNHLNLSDELCQYCDQKFYKFVTLLKHEADHHGITRTKEDIFGDDLWNIVNKKIEQQKQIQIQNDMEKIENQLNFLQ
ncbi:hypothetical protein pb186bvf_011667 [Paramecium bursaria]